MGESSNDKKPPSPSDTTAPGSSVVSPTPASATPASGKRQAFDDVLRPLTPEELASPGTQKIILYMLQQTQAENDQLDGYVERFHDADKRAAVLQEQLTAERKTSKSVDIIVIGGTALGGAIFGAAFYFFGKTPPDDIGAVIALAIGILLIGAAISAKIAQR